MEGGQRRNEDPFEPFQRAPRGRRRLIAVLVGVLAVGGLLTACGGDSSSRATGSPSLALVPAQTYCQQDSVVGNVDVVVTLRNTGTSPAEDVNIRPIRKYASGREVGPVGDTMTGIMIPADGRPHREFHSYSVASGERIVRCEIKVLSPAFARPGVTIPIQVRGSR